MKHVLPPHEKRKVVIDLYRHFSTISIAILALGAAFFGQFSELDQGATLLAVAVSCFFLVLIVSGTAQFLLVASLEEMSQSILELLRWTFIIAFLSFFCGAGAFVYLVYINT